jgi:large subunit ribosomal protein L19
MKNLIDAIEKEQFRALPTYRVGDQLRVHMKIVEGESERVQVFEGTVIRQRGHGLSKMFTIRKVSFGIGVERTIPAHSPRIEKIEIVRSGHVRRAKLYFLRDLTGRAARLDEKTAIQKPAAKAAAPAASPSPAKA